MYHAFNNPKIRFFGNLYFITLGFLASAALTCAGVLRIGALLEEELQLLRVSSFGSSTPPPRPTDPGPFFLVSGVFTKIY